MTSRVPFVGSRILRSISRKFIGVGDLLTHTSPYIELHLRQSGVSEGYNISAREYLSVCFTVLLLHVLVGSTLLYMLFNASEKGNPLIGAAIGVVAGLLMYIYLLVYPKYIVNKRVKKVERTLLYA